MGIMPPQQRESEKFNLPRKRYRAKENQVDAKLASINPDDIVIDDSASDLDEKAEIQVVLHEDSIAKA